RERRRRVLCLPALYGRAVLDEELHGGFGGTRLLPFAWTPTLARPAPPASNVPPKMPCGVAARVESAARTLVPPFAQARIQGEVGSCTIACGGLSTHTMIASRRASGGYNVPLPASRNCDKSTRRVVRRAASGCNEATMATRLARARERRRRRS